MLLLPPPPDIRWFLSYLLELFCCFIYLNKTVPIYWKLVFCGHESFSLFYYKDELIVSVKPKLFSYQIWCWKQKYGITSWQIAIAGGYGMLPLYWDLGFSRTTVVVYHCFTSNFFGIILNKITVCHGQTFSYWMSFEEFVFQNIQKFRFFEIRQCLYIKFSNMRFLFSIKLQ